MCCVCNSYVAFALRVLCVVFALLPANCTVCVNPVLCLLNVLPAQFAMWELRQVFLLLFYFAIFIALLPAQCAVCCVCTTASAVCCVCNSYVVFALLPAQCAVCVSPVLCLYYCSMYYQHSW